MFYFLTFYHDIHKSVIGGNTNSLTFHSHDVSSPTMADATLLLSLSPSGLQRMIDNAYNYSRMWRIK